MNLIFALHKKFIYIHRSHPDTRERKRRNIEYYNATHDDTRGGYNSWRHAYEILLSLDWLREQLRRNAILEEIMNLQFGRYLSSCDPIGDREKKGKEKKRKKKKEKTVGSPGLGADLIPGVVASAAYARTSPVSWQTSECACAQLHFTRDTHRQLCAWWNARGWKRNRESPWREPGRV